MIDVRNAASRQYSPQPNDISKAMDSMFYFFDTNKLSIAMHKHIGASLQFVNKYIFIYT